MCKTNIKFQLLQASLGSASSEPNENQISQATPTEAAEGREMGEALWLCLGTASSGLSCMIDQYTFCNPWGSGQAGERAWLTAQAPGLPVGPGTFPPFLLQLGYQPQAVPAEGTWWGEFLWLRPGKGLSVSCSAHRQTSLAS